MNFSRVVLSLALSALAATPIAAAKKPHPDAFQSDVARISLHKPAGWHFQTLETAYASRAAVKMNDAQFQEAVEKLASAPLLIATRHEEPYDSLNPALQVLVRPLGTLEGSSGVEILRLVEPALRVNFTDFTTVDSIRAVTVSGHAAARLTARYVVKARDDREFPTQATIVVVPRGKVLYQFGFSGPPTGSDALTTEVDSVLASVRFLE